jgi:hypothetical protein
MARSSLVVGAHCRVYINGKPFGRTISAQLRSATPRRKIHVLDTFVAAEHMPTTAETGGTIQIYRLHGDGGSQAAGIVAPFADLSLEKYFSILILDRVTDTVIYRADRCTLEEEDWGLPTRGYVTGSLSFSAITWGNETQSKMTSGG